MYWIYLFIFITIVFVPDLVRRNFYFLSEEKMEEVLIFFFGALTFALYIYQEKRLGKYFREKISARQEARQAGKDLTLSYSYIGEVNRKLEIFRNISVLVAEEAIGINFKKKEKIFKEIIQAIKTISKINKCSVFFLDRKTGDVFRDNKEMLSSTSQVAILLKKYFFLPSKIEKTIIEEKKKTIVFCSKKKQKMAAVVIFETAREKLPDNVVLIQALLFYMLFLENMLLFKNRSYNQIPRAFEKAREK